MPKAIGQVILVRDQVIGCLTLGELLVVLLGLAQLIRVVITFILKPAQVV